METCRTKESACARSCGECAQAQQQSRWFQLVSEEGLRRASATRAAQSSTVEHADRDSVDDSQGWNGRERTSCAQGEDAQQCFRVGLSLSLSAVFKQFFLFFSFSWFFFLKKKF
jgi:hypothetical protein